MTSPGVYYCTVSDDDGAERTSDDAEVNYSLYISQQPRNANIQGRNSVTLACSASGGVPFENDTYMFAWYDEAGNLVAFTEDGTAEVTETGNYYCVVQDNQDGLVTSDTAIVYSGEPLKVECQKKTYYMVPGEETVDVQMSVTGGRSRYHYIWTLNDGTILTAYDGYEATASWTANDLGTYTLTVIDEMGEIQTGTANVEYRQLKIAHQPEGGMLDSDGFFELSIAMEEGKEPFTYMLYKDDDLIDYTSDTAIVSGAGDYYFHVEDADGRWADSKKAAVENFEFGIDHIEVERDLYDQEDSVELRAVLKGTTPSAEYEWSWAMTQYGNSKVLPDTGETCTATRPGYYFCTAKFGKDSSSDKALVVYNGDLPLIVRQPQSVTMKRDSAGLFSFRLDILVVGPGNRTDGFEYEWECRGANARSSYGMEFTPNGATGNDPTLNWVYRRGKWLDDYARYYRCRVTDTLTGGVVYSDEALVVPELTIKSMEYNPEEGKLHVYIDGGVPLYSVTAIRHWSAEQTWSGEAYTGVMYTDGYIDGNEGIVQVVTLGDYYDEEKGRFVNYTPVYHIIVRDALFQETESKTFTYKDYMN